MEARLTVEQVAGLLHADPESVRRAIRERKLRASKPCGRWLVLERDVEAWCEASTAEQAEPARPSPERPRALQAAPAAGSFRELMDQHTKAA